MRKRCAKCQHRVECMILFDMCLLEKEKLERLQKLVDHLPRNHTQKRLLIRRVVNRFAGEFEGSWAQRKGEAKLFILKHASKLQGYDLTANRNAFKARR